MGHGLTLLVAAMTLGASPVLATTMGTDTGSSTTTALRVAQSGTNAKSSVPPSQAQADKSARKASASARKLAKKCAKWSRKAASAHSERKRAKFSARYNSRCVTAAKATTQASSAPTDSTVIDVVYGEDAMSGLDAVSSVVDSTSVAGLTALTTGAHGPAGINTNGASPLQVAAHAVRFAPELVTAQVPEAGTLALVAGLTAVTAGTDGLAGISTNDTPSLKVAALAARLAPEMVTAQVPEPGTLALLGLGLTGLALSRKRKKAASRFSVVFW